MTDESPFEAARRHLGVALEDQDPRTPGAAQSRAGFAGCAAHSPPALPCQVVAGPHVESVNPVVVEAPSRRLVPVLLRAVAPGSNVPALPRGAVAIVAAESFLEAVVQAPAGIDVHQLPGI